MQLAQSVNDLFLELKDHHTNLRETVMDNLPTKQMMFLDPIEPARHGMEAYPGTWDLPQTGMFTSIVFPCRNYLSFVYRCDFKYQGYKIDQDGVRHAMISRP